MIKVEFRFSCGRGKFVCLLAFGEVLPLNMPQAEREKEMQISEYECIYVSI